MLAKNYSEAEKAFSNGLRIEPNNEDLRRKHQTVTELIRNLTSTDATLSPSSIAKEEGTRHFKESRYLEAIDCYSRALHLNPTNEEKIAILNNRGLCYKQLQNFSDVVADCTAVLELQPTNVKALIRRGLAYESIEKYKLAIQDMRRTLEIDPSAHIASEAIARLDRILKMMV
eukprot:TRINITY_DN1043_c0_g1_i1.p1 TRINITY_DN1043_c0_g1~~TRINITY_DN1043_c0_g1_i1.p1  ORF type:complete len:173 (-),score=90.71 TRINITY_DN1043_c0_g1_i1:173-691(-)